MPAPSSSGERADLYSGGIDAVTVRVVLGYSSQSADWTVKRAGKKRF